MGVKDLWNILSPACEKKSLWELEGKIIAVDLSSWIVDSQLIGDNSVINMYLRNLFFRTSYLLLLGVKPIFILEGRAPELKHDTISRRQQLLNKENKTKNPNLPNKNGNRGRLNSLQKQCENLLLSLGVRCYKSEGEAEALCSKLNEMGVVYAVISQDSDCFLYGARTVLRNFTMSPSYTCDMYRMENIEEKLKLGRQKLLALSLLCGCDYESGVQGVGKQSALKFLASLPDDQVLDRLRSWRNDESCTSQTKLSQLSQEQKIEHTICKKALLDPAFPSEEVIAEFLSFQPVDIPSFVWGMPSLPNFMVIGDRKLAWEEDYIQSKFMPLVTRWHLLNKAGIRDLNIVQVVKKRLVRGVPSYELRWQFDGIDEFTTVEPICLVEQVYPEKHEAFVKSKEKPKKGGKGKKKKVQETDISNVENLFGNLSIENNKAKQPNKKRTKLKPLAGLQTLDKFVLKQANKSVLNKDRELVPTPQSIVSHSTPVRDSRVRRSYHYLSDETDTASPDRKIKSKSASCENINNESLHQMSTQNSLSFNSLLDFTVDSAAFDLSDIVNSIVSRTENPALNMLVGRNLQL